MTRGPNFFAVQSATRAAPQQEGAKPAVDASEAFEFFAAGHSAVTKRGAIPRAAPFCWGATAASRRSNCRKVRPPGRGAIVGTGRRRLTCRRADDYVFVKPNNESTWISPDSGRRWDDVVYPNPRRPLEPNTPSSVWRRAHLGLGAATCPQRKKNKRFPGGGQHCPGDKSRCG
jgi:hypothetical protein